MIKTRQLLFALPWVVWGSLAHACTPPQVPERLQCPKDWEINLGPKDALRSLWQAAREGDEQAFIAGLAAHPDINRYSFRGVPLLASLLQPPQLLIAKDDRWSHWSPTRLKRFQHDYQQLVARKERMLALGLRQKLRWQSCGSPYPYGLPPLLYLASYFGSSNMLDQLIQAGVSPRQSVCDGGNALDELLHPNTSGDLPDLTNKQTFGHDVARMLQAGAGEPFAALGGPDKADARQVAARRLYLVWEPMLRNSVTEEGLEALWSRGIRPEAQVDGNDLNSPIALAVAYQNPVAAAYLRARLPRMVKAAKGGADHDQWLSAAGQALYSMPDQVGNWLSGPVQWDRRFAVYGSERFGAQAHRPDQPQVLQSESHTLLEHAILAEQPQWFARLAAQAPKPLPPALLQLAISHGQSASALWLLQQWTTWPTELSSVDAIKQLLRDAINQDNAPLVEALLSKMPAAERTSALKQPWLLADLESIGSMHAVSPAQRLAMLQTFIVYGVDPAQFRSELVVRLMTEGDWSSALLLLKNAAPLSRWNSEAAPGVNELQQAARAGRLDLVEVLLQRGVNPNANLAAGWQGTALSVALAEGQAAVVSRLQRAGAHLPPSERLQAATTGHDFAELQRSSRVVPGGLSGDCPSRAALALALRDARWLKALMNAGLRREYRCDGKKSQLYQDLVESLLDGQTLPLFDAAARAQAGKALRLARGPGRSPLLPATLDRIRNDVRFDLLALLQSQRVVIPVERRLTPVKPGAAAMALQGRYRTTPASAGRAELELKPSGRFVWNETAGAEHIAVNGNWSMQQQKLQLQQDPLPAVSRLHSKLLSDEGPSDGLVLQYVGGTDLTGPVSRVMLDDGGPAPRVLDLREGSTETVRLLGPLRALAYQFDPGHSAWEGVILPAATTGASVGTLVFGPLPRGAPAYRLRNFAWDPEFSVRQDGHGKVLANQDGLVLEKKR